MKRKKIKFMAMFLVLVMSVGLLASCGRTVAGDETINKEDTNITEETENKTSISYVETDDSFRIKNLVDIDKTLADGKVMDWTKWERVETYIHLKESIDIYDENKGKIGYTKANIDAVYVAIDGDWSHLAIGESGFGVYVRTDELLAIMEEVEETENTEEVTNTENSQDVDSTYTVTDMTKTMYAKQSVNLRSGPSTDYDKVGSLTTNQEVTVTGQADTGWYRISYNGGEAFVSNTYLSDTKVEIPTSPDDGGNTDEEENNSEEEYTPPTDDVIIEEPEPTYTVDEVIAIVKSTLESNGMQWYPDVFPNSEYGPSGGMGWGIGNIPMDDPYTYANGMVEGFQYNGWNLYYIEYLGVENGCVVLKIYSGTLPK